MARFGVLATLVVLAIMGRRRTGWAVASVAATVVVVQCAGDGMDQRISQAVTVPGVDVFYYHNDHLDTPRALSDESGAVVWSATYSAFGQRTVTGTAVEQPFVFPGQYADAETGLYYNWHRYYNPVWGRYVSADPVDPVVTAREVRDSKKESVRDSFRRRVGKSVWLALPDGFSNDAIAIVGTANIPQHLQPGSLSAINRVNLIWATLRYGYSLNNPLKRIDYYGLQSEYYKIYPHELPIDWPDDNDPSAEWDHRYDRCEDQYGRQFYTPDLGGNHLCTFKRTEEYYQAVGFAGYINISGQRNCIYECQPWCFIHNLPGQ